MASTRLLADGSAVTAVSGATRSRRPGGDGGADRHVARDGGDVARIRPGGGDVAPTVHESGPSTSMSQSVAGGEDGGGPQGAAVPDGDDDDGVGEVGGNGEGGRVMVSVPKITRRAKPHDTKNVASLADCLFDASSTNFLICSTWPR